MICEFKGPNYPLSNFYVARLTWANVPWSSAEHAFQAAKTRDEGWRRKIMLAKTPGEAKKLGRACPIREDWDDVKELAMESIVCAKFLTATAPSLAETLLATGEQTLVEGNTWGDRVWGAVITDDTRPGEQVWKLDADGPDRHLIGQNLLGKILMRVRADIRLDRELHARMLDRQLVERSFALGPITPLPD